MSNRTTLDIVKGALLLEHRGRALYKSVVSSSKVEAVRELFAMLAEEENQHIAFLNRQYSRLLNGEAFDPATPDSEHAEASDWIFAEDIVAKISGAGYEAAVISAALDFEKKAVSYYTDRAEKAESEEERSVFTWLSRWEKTHMVMLARLDDELKERIWFDHQFWPLD